MPFPLAHPAAVLPFRRYRLLNFPALVLGSIAPDLGYVFGPLHVENFSHSFAGAFGFCLPAGVVLYWLLRRCVQAAGHNPLARRLVSVMPPVLPIRSLCIIALSLLLGAFSHLLWDGFTHKQGWFVERLPLLQAQIMTLFGHRLRVFHVLWYGCSFLGVAWLYIVYEHWKHAPEPAANTPQFNSTVRRRSLAVATIAFLLGLVHHLFNRWQNVLVAVFLTAMVVAGLIVWLGWVRKRA